MPVPLRWLYFILFSFFCVLSHSLQIYCRYTDGYAPVLLQFSWLWIVFLLHQITGLGSLRCILREIYSLLMKSTLFGCVDNHTHSFKFGAPLLLTISQLADCPVASSSVPLILRVPFNSSHGVLLLCPRERSRTSRTLCRLLSSIRTLVQTPLVPPVVLRSFTRSDQSIQSQSMIDHE
jgi:hypothetical protein